MGSGIEGTKGEKRAWRWARTAWCLSAFDIFDNWRPGSPTRKHVKENWLRLSTLLSRVTDIGPLKDWTMPQRFAARHQGESYMTMAFTVSPRIVLEKTSSFAFGNGGSNTISLYKGVGTDTTTFRHLKSPRAEET